MLLVEQNARAALRLAGRGYVLETGCVVVSGTSQALMAAPRVRSAYWESGRRRRRPTRAPRRSSSSMISRQWRGLAKPARADEYVEHLRTETLPQLSSIPGCIDAAILRRAVGDGVEFLIVTRWDSIAAIQRFAGPDAGVAVVPDKVQEMMLEYDRTVRHYEIVE